jgi:hypothetical protein
MYIYTLIYFLSIYSGLLNYSSGKHKLCSGSEAGPGHITMCCVPALGPGRNTAYHDVFRIS